PLELELVTLVERLGDERLRGAHVALGPRRLDGIEDLVHALLELRGVPVAVAGVGRLRDVLGAPGPATRPATALARALEARPLAALHPELEHHEEDDHPENDRDRGDRASAAARAAA